MRTLLLICIFPLMIAASFVVADKKIPAKPCTIDLPRTRKGCSGEICECRTGNSLRVDARLYSKPSKKSKVIKRLKAKTRLRSRELYTITKAFGLGKRTDSNSYVHIISFIGEGNSEICEGSETKVETVLWDKEVKYEQWAKVTLADRSMGWILTSALTGIEGDNCDFDPPLKD